MEIQLTFRYEPQDAIDVITLRQSFIPASRLLKILGIFILVLLGVLGGIFLFFNLLSLINPYFFGLPVNEFLTLLSSFRDGFLFLSICLIPFLLFFLMKPIWRFRVWLMNRRNPEMFQKERNFIFDEQGITYSHSSVSSNFKWDYFKRIVEGQKHYLLVEAKNNYYVIPKRSFSASADEEQFRNLVTSKLGPTQARI